MTEPWPGSRPWTPSEVRGRRRRTLSGYQRGIGEQDGRGRGNLMRVPSGSPRVRQTTRTGAPWRGYGGDRRGEAGLITFMLDRNATLARPSTKQLQRSEQRPSVSCRRVSGTRELLGWRAVGSAAPDWVFNVAVCLNRPSVATLKQVELILGPSASVAVPVEPVSYEAPARARAGGAPVW
jgi:hypothetical protein